MQLKGIIAMGSTNIEVDRRVTSCGRDSTAMNVITLTDSPLGDVELPNSVYERINHLLPRCLQHGDDDSRSNPRFPSRPLKREIGSSVMLHTRNITLLARLIEAEGFRIQVRRSFNNDFCQSTSPSEFPYFRSLLSKIKTARTEADQAAKEIDDAVSWARAGLLISPDSENKYNCAAILCSLFPRAPIVFIEPSRESVMKTALELEKRLPEKVHRTLGLHSIPASRITVATFQSFLSEDLRDAPFVIISTWQPGFPKWMRRLTWSPYLDRIYVLLTTSDRLSDQDADNLAGRVGPILVRPRGTLKGVTTFSTFRFGGRNTRRSIPVKALHASERQKHYWRHRQRNIALAALADRLECSDGAIAILVESRGHAEQLSRLLPDWAVVGKEMIPTEQPSRMIITLTAAAAWSKFRPGTLVNAMGGSPSLWLCEFVNGLNMCGNSVHVVDLTDGFDDAAAQFAVSRQNAYRASGGHFRPLHKSVVMAVGRKLRDETVKHRS